MAKYKSTNIVKLYIESNDMRVRTEKFARYEKRVKKQRRKRRRKAEKRIYLYEKGDYVEPIQKDKKCMIVATIGGDCTRDVFRFSGEYDIEKGKKLCFSKFQKWAKNRDIRGPFKPHWTKGETGELIMLIEKTPDMKVYRDKKRLYV